MIGHLVAAWELGVLDERAARPWQRGVGKHGVSAETRAYRAARIHEREAMRREKRLAQLELELTA